MRGLRLLPMLFGARLLPASTEALGDDVTEEAMDAALQVADTFAPLNQSGLADDLLRLDYLVKALCPNHVPSLNKRHPDWLSDQSIEAGCIWICPMIERMAAGEEVPIEEIGEVYREHNGGQPMPRGTLPELVRLVMAGAE